MKLNELKEVGCVSSVGFDDVVQDTIKWEGHEFDVFIKPEMTYADYEFIYVGKGDDDSFAARRIHRFVLLEGYERIPYEDAKALKPSLVTALTAAINKVQNKHKKPDEKKH